MSRPPVDPPGASMCEVHGGRVLRMLSNTARPIVEATLPVVGANIGTITQRFYGHLFTEHPELLDGTFNRGNQAAGTQPQALAGSVAAFASALVTSPDRPPERLLSRIAHKHASLAVQPEQYKVVHDHLMWAIGDVLGDAVTPAVAAAWDEVYWLMANALINAERDLYSARGVQPDTTWRRWRVEHKIAETADVDTFVVTPVDGLPAPASLPGQYVTVLLAMPDGMRQPRQYSLTRTDDGRNCQFTVKWVHGDGMPDGEVSSLLHHTIDVGDELTMSPPYGDVVLGDRTRPVVCASAGIGITPMAGMLSHLAAAGSTARVMLLHADLDERSFALRRQVVGDIAALPGASVHVWYERGAETELPLTDVFAGTMDVSRLPLPEGAVFYLCGPLPFMQAIRSGLMERGVAARDIRYEIFGPDLWLANTD
ncbi:FAD-binding oxidoreductase [Krasilnikovia sp. MM14-A1004]